MGTRRKYNFEFRLRCVEAVLKGENSLKVISKENGIEHSNLRLWVMFYEAYGEAGLKSRANRHYDVSFKLTVLKIIEEEHLSLREACVRFNIATDSVIIKWRKAYESEGHSGLIAKPKGRSSNMKLPIKRKAKVPSRPLTREEELLKENEYLRAENELLKKLQALAQTKKKQKP
ncbi:MAG: helix-turn-helix domain-containing protein [Chitinophagaceae bacterium]|jgi:transposase